MNLLQLRTEVLAHGFDPIQYGARATNYINDGYQLIASRVDYYVDDAIFGFPTVAQSPQYPLPTDFARVREFSDSTDRIPLQAVAIEQIDESPIVYGRPAWYAIVGATVIVYPFPDGVYNMAFRYWKTPTPLAADTDTPNLPATWHKLLWEYAVQQCFEADDDPNMGQFWGQKFNNDLAMFAADVKFPNVDRPHQVAGMWNQDQPLLSANGWGFYGI